VRFLLRLLLCLVVGTASGLLGGALGLALGGSSVQQTAAGRATVTVKVGRPAGLTVTIPAPAAVLSVSPWTVPLRVEVSATDTDPAVLVNAVVDPGAATTLAREGLDALLRAGEQAALAALIGALAVGLIGGIAVSTFTRRRRHVLLVMVIAVLAAAAPVAIGVGQIAAVGTNALSAPNCPLAPQVSLDEATRVASSPQSDPELARAVAIEAACSPAFQASVRQALHGQ